MRRGRGPGRKPAPSAETTRRQFVRRFPWPVLLLGPIALIMLVMAVGLTWQWVSLEGAGIRASAVIVSEHPVSRAPGTVRVEFLDGAGNRRQAEVVVAARPEPGSRVSVLYSPTDPEAVRLDDSLDNLMVLSFFWGMSIGLIIAIRQAVRQARRRV